MRIFKFLVALAPALALALAAGYLSSLCLAKGVPDLVYPVYAAPALFFNISQLAALGLSVFAVSLSFYRRKIRKCLPFWLLVYAVNVLIYVSFFVWGLYVLTFALLLAESVLALLITLYYVKTTGELWLTTLPVAMWYLYLFLVVFGVIILN
jgi:hypothetical protein